MISDYTFTTFVYLWIGLVLIPNNLKSLTAKALCSWWTLLVASGQFLILVNLGLFFQFPSINIGQSWSD